MLRTTEQLNELRERCNESVRLNATFYPSVLIKDIGYLACKRWLSGETDVNPLAEIPLNYNRTNTGPKYEQGILQALDEVAPVSSEILPDLYEWELEFMEESPDYEIEIVYLGNAWDD